MGWVSFMVTRTILLRVFCAFFFLVNIKEIKKETEKLDHDEMEAFVPTSRFKSSLFEVETNTNECNLKNEKPFWFCIIYCIIYYFGFV